MVNSRPNSKTGRRTLGDLIGLVYQTASKLANLVGLGMKKYRGKGIVGDLIGLVYQTAEKSSEYGRIRNEKEK